MHIRFLIVGIIGVAAFAGVWLAQPSPTSAHHIAAISAGGQHTCALTVDGEVQCWGRNQFGELGNGTYDDSALPVTVAGLAGETVVAIGSGAVHTCAVTDEGSVYCWGGIDSFNSNAPVQIAGLAGVIDTAGGFHHNCVLTGTGGVKCWGRGTNGQLGNGSTSSSDTPVDVLEAPGGYPISNAVALTSGDGFHNCIVTDTGGAQCWGQNWYGQLGDGNGGGIFVDISTTPVDVSGLTSDVVAIAAGEEHTCAVVSGGAAKCWGINDDGQVGDGTRTRRLIPADVVGLSAGVVSIAAGGLTSCAVLDTGSARCWGFNFFGQVGDGTIVSPRTTPVDVVYVDNNVAQISPGGIHSCALTTTGGVMCWGDDRYGQVGDLDHDGCTDFAEHGTNAAQGGLRDSENQWDFFDTPNMMGVRDKAVVIDDIMRVATRFGSSGDPDGDPDSMPPMMGYHTAFDRGGSLGSYAWNQAPPDGIVAVSDIVAVVSQFGHSCM